MNCADFFQLKHVQICLRTQEYLLIVFVSVLFSIFRTGVLFLLKQIDMFIYFFVSECHLDYRRADTLLIFLYICTKYVKHSLQSPGLDNVRLLQGVFAILVYFCRW